MHPLRWLDAAQAELEEAGLFRTRRAPAVAPGPWLRIEGRELLNLCSNDYLSLASRPAVSAAAGAGASRLVGGDVEPHVRFEVAAAEWLDREDALLFSSGYGANVGAISALADARTLIVSDALNHASIVDGCRLSRARVVVVPHGDLTAMEDALASAREPKRLLATDAYFSMDGDVAPLEAERALCDRYDAALYVDEAHALGVLGRDGRGACDAAGVAADVVIGTLGKSFGLVGAFVVGDRALTRWLWNRARSFVFSTGASPAIASAALERLADVREGSRTRRMQSNAAVLRGELARLGVEVRAGSQGPILPVVLGDGERARAVAAGLLSRGVFVHPILPPTVPKGTARLRLTVQADHRPADLRWAAEQLREALE